MDKPFSPTGPTFFVGTSATQIGAFGYAGNCWRIRNLSTSAQYFTHGQTAAVTNASAPAQNAPALNTIGMLPQSVEVFSGLLPWMIAGSATGFEVTPGDGQ